MSEHRVGYRFGPLERRGLLGPLDVTQSVALAGSLVAAVAIVDAVPSGAGAIIGLLLVLFVAGLALVPVGGRPPAAWTPLVARWGTRSLTGRRLERSPHPGTGRRASPSVDRVALDFPRALGRVELERLTYRRSSVGAIGDRSGRWLCATLACEVGSFGLLDPPAQERRLAQWGVLLATAANSPLRRLQWIERSTPAEGDGLARWLADQRDPQLGAPDSPLLQSYLELIASEAPALQAHELLLTLQLDAGKIRGGPAVARQRLLEEAERVARGLEAAEVRVLGALSPEQYARALRTGFDPFATLAHRTEEGGPLDPVTAGPLAVREHWDHLEADGARHATYWIAGWPRVEMPATFMAGLLAPSQVVRTVAVTFEPLSAERATREVEAAVTRDRADRELRHRFGQSETARQRQAQESALRREAELAAGHGEVRFAGFVTVSGRDADELRRASEETLQHAATARLELRRMYGRQAEAHTFTLPLARGLA